MESFFGSGPLPDWKEVRQWLGKELPWKLVEQWEKADDGEWLDGFIKGLLKQESEQRSTEARTLVQINAFKNANKVTATVRIPPGANLRSLRLFATSDGLRVTGLPDNLTHSVRFPCRVYPRSGQAVQKNDRILVHFRRRPVNSEEVELFIRS